MRRSEGIKLKGETSDKAGFALVAALTWLIIGCTLVSAMVYVSRMNLETRVRQRAFVHAYAIAYGTAKDLEKSIASNQSPSFAPPATIEGMQVRYQQKVGSTSTSVKVEVYNSWVQDTISFTYDTIAHRLTLWQDNGPGF